MIRFKARDVSMLVKLQTTVVAAPIVKRGCRLCNGTPIDEWLQIFMGVMRRKTVRKKRASTAFISVIA